MSGHIIIVTKPGGAINEGVLIIRQEELPKLFDEIVELANPPELITFQWPTNYPGIVTQAFGVNPDYYGKFGLPGHEGIDMRALMNTPIFAAWGGRVVRNEFHEAYGNSIRIEAEIRGDVYEFIYAHLVTASIYKVGELIGKGANIGFAGSTGNSTGPHLHFSLKKRGATASGETDYPWDIINSTEFFVELRD